jgi:ferredoxin-NADP reductase
MMRDAQTFEPAESRLTRPAFFSRLGERWTSDVEETLVCCQVRQETHDVKSFFFMSREGRTFAFEPGQFITLELEIGGETINRCYTISSAPTRPHTISITVKRVPGGKVSNWLHDNLRAGDAVRALGPAGEFTCARRPASKYLFLSAGSGITPLMSMSRASHELGEDRDIVFLHSARTPDDIIFARELDLIAASQQRFRTSFVCERLGQRTNWSGVTGYLTLDLLKLVAPDFMEREVFTCGPAPYMEAVRGMLAEAGFDSSRYHEESFTFGAPSVEGLQDESALEADGEASEPTSGARFAVTFAKSRRDIECEADQHVLDAARQAGLRLPASCTQGMCGTCKVKLVSGQVDMKHNGGIRQREIDQGMVLLCCSKPLSDLVIEK